MVPLRVIELASYQAILSCAAAGTGAALLPSSVLASYLGRRHLSVHALPGEMKEVRTVLIWRMGSGGAKINYLLEVLNRLRVRGGSLGRRGAKRANPPKR
jgi:DNA-binding transcriptional LysR family regulator